MVDIKKVSAYFGSESLLNLPTITSPALTTVYPQINVAALIPSPYGGTGIYDPFSTIQTRSFPAAPSGEFPAKTVTGFVAPFSRRYKLRCVVRGQGAQLVSGVTLSQYFTFSAATLSIGGYIHRAGSATDFQYLNATSNIYGSIELYKSAGSYSANQYMGSGIFGRYAVLDSEVELLAGDFVHFIIIYGLNFNLPYPPGVTLRLVDSPFITAELTEISDI